MTYKDNDWLTVCRRLEKARQSYEAYMAQDKGAKDPELLDEGILRCWTFGEYAINAVLEKSGFPVVKDHSQPSKAKDLFQASRLQRDYSHLRAPRKIPKTRLPSRLCKGRFDALQLCRSQEVPG